MDARDRVPGARCAASPECKPRHRTPCLQGEFLAKEKPIPDGYHNVTPYLVVKGAAAAIDFYKEVFGAVEIMRMPQPDGRVGHAELKFGDSFVMMADEFPEMDVVGPKTLGNSPVGLLLYVDDVDKTVERAVARAQSSRSP